MSFKPSKDAAGEYCDVADNAINELGGHEFTKLEIVHSMRLFERLVIPFGITKKIWAYNIADAQCYSDKNQITAYLGSIILLAETEANDPSIAGTTEIWKDILAIALTMQTKLPFRSLSVSTIQFGIKEIREYLSKLPG
jgi:hypothetical protein